MENALPKGFRRALRRGAPWLYDQLWRLGPRNYPIVHAITRHSGWVVQAGPFRGMRYIRHAAGSALAPKLLGAYECEVHPLVERALASSPERVVDIGAAEGYYAVGCALRLPQAHVHAFDTEPLARELCADLARLNDVSSRVHIHGLCTQAHLAELAPALIISDCEGGELGLLDPSHVPELTTCSLLIEMHDFIDPRISGILAARFESTHTRDVVRTLPRDPADYPALISLSPPLAALALEEARPAPMEWAYLAPRN